MPPHPKSLSQNSPKPHILQNSCQKRQVTLNSTSVSSPRNLPLSFIVPKDCLSRPSTSLHLAQPHTNVPWNVSDGHLRHWQISIQHITLLTQHMSVLSVLPSMLCAKKGNKDSSVYTGNKHMKHASRDHTSHSESCTEWCCRGESEQQNTNTN